MQFTRLNTMRQLGGKQFKLLMMSHPFVFRRVCKTIAKNELASSRLCPYMYVCLSVSVYGMYVCMYVCVCVQYLCTCVCVCVCVYVQYVCSSGWNKAAPAVRMFVNFYTSTSY